MDEIKRGENAKGLIGKERKKPGDDKTGGPLRGNDPKQTEKSSTGRGES